MARPKPSKWKPGDPGQKVPSTEPKALREALFKVFGAKSDPASASEVDALLLWAKKEFYANHDVKRRGPTRGQMKAALVLLTEKAEQLEEQLSSTDSITAELVAAHLASSHKPPRTGLGAFTSALGEFQAAISASLKVMETENPGEVTFNLWPRFEHSRFRPDKSFDPLDQFFINVFLGIQGIDSFAAQSIPSFAWNSKTEVSKRCKPVVKAAPDFLKHFKSTREYAEAAERARREVQDQANFETDAPPAQA